MDIGEMIRSHSKDVAELKKIKRQRDRLLNPQQQPAQYQQIPQDMGAGSMVIGASTGDDEYESFDQLESEELERMLGRARGQSKEIIEDILRQREYGEELDSLDALGDEIDDLTFHAVKYAEGNAEEWIYAYTRIAMDGVDSLLARLRKDHPLATRVKWGRVKKGKQEIKSLSDRAFTFKTDAAARLTAAPEQQFHQPQPQQDGMQGMAAVMRVIQESTAATQTGFIQLMAVLKEDKAPPKNPMEEMLALKTALLDPQMAMQLEMFKAMNPKGQGLDGMATAKMIIDGAQTLSKGSSGGADSGLLSLIKEVGPVILDTLQKLQPQQGNGQPQGNGQQSKTGATNEDLPTQQKALPGPAQGQQMNQLEAQLQDLCRRIVKHLLSEKLKLDQIPRYIYRNFDPTIGQAITEMTHQKFRSTVEAAVGRDPTLRAFVSNPKVHQGMQWIHEEFGRLVMGLSILDSQGNEKEIEERLHYDSEVFIETELRGAEAQKEFFSRYQITREDLVKINAIPEDEQVPEEEEDLPIAQQEPPASPPEQKRKVHQPTIEPQPRKKIKVKRKALSFRPASREKVAEQQ